MVNLFIMKYQHDTQLLNFHMTLIPFPVRSFFCLYKYATTLLFLIIFSGALLPANVLGSLEDTAFDETILIYLKVPGNHDIAQDKKNIHTLSYTQLRALRAFCKIPDINVKNIKPVLKKLQTTDIRYDTVLLLDYFTNLPQATISSSWIFLDLLSNTSFAAKKTLASLPQTAPNSAASLLPVIKEVKKLNESGQWAVKALFEVQHKSFTEVQQAISLISTMPPGQQWAAEKLCRLPKISGSEVVQNLHFIRLLSDNDSWNVRALFNDHSMTPTTASRWLSHFFSLSVKSQDALIKQMPVEDNHLLLTTYNNAAPDIIRDINSFHDVTNRFGREIGTWRLKNFPAEKLLFLLSRLPQKAQDEYRKELEKALNINKRNEAISALRKATTMGRKLTAKELTGANLYVLLTHGGELFTSSFKNYLVPVLAERIKANFKNNLLLFITTIDPKNRYTSDFIINLASKGSLTRFLPQKSNEQKKVLDLVTASALQNEHSLLLFSAAFTKLLTPLHTKARSHLLELLMAAAVDRNCTFSMQLRVILQYYLEKRSNLLSPKDRKKISTMLTQYPPVNIADLSKTPFTEWLKDHKLRSLSIFQNDDDGRSSFLSNCRALLAAGYKPVLSSNFFLSYLSLENHDELKLLFKSLRRKPDYGLIQLFRFSVKHPIVCDWVKKQNGITITHSVSVYQGKEQQQRLIVQFIKNKTEMFAQRGHSYWRPKQLFIPLEKALSAGELRNSELFSKQRFLSLGSCGGLRAYSDISRQFHDKVDILATTGTGKSVINNPYNRKLFEIIAKKPEIGSWDDIARKTASIFAENLGEEYIQPGSLPAILHKMLHRTRQNNGTDQTN